MRLAAYALTTALTALGAVLAGRSSDNFLLAMVLTGAWFAAVGVVAILVLRRRRRLFVPVGAGVATVAIVMTVLVGLPTLIGKTVDETVVVGTQAVGAAAGGAANVERVSGDFVSIAHDGRGRAAVVELPDGTRKLTLTSFATDSGPDLRVYLTTQDPTGGGIGEFVDLGALKGNRGDQQYDVPARVDLERYPVVVIWCRAFSVPFTSAALRAPRGAPAAA